MIKLKNILEKSFYEDFKIIKQFDYINKLEKNIENNKNQLREHFNKKDKELLLRIIDAKDLKAEEMCLDSYIYGFKLGLKFGYEVNREQ